MRYVLAVAFVLTSRRTIDYICKHSVFSVYRQQLHYYFIRTFSSEHEAEKLPKFIRMFYEHAEAEERRRTFILDTA